jgi:hypothetical protein
MYPLFPRRWGGQMSYFGGLSLGFLGGFPTDGQFLIFSTLSSGYQAFRDMGLIPAICSRFSAVRGLSRPSSLAISSIVKPSIIYISERVTKKIKKINNFRHFAKKTLEIFSHLCEN